MTKVSIHRFIPTRLQQGCINRVTWIPETEWIPEIHVTLCKRFFKESEGKTFLSTPFHIEAIWPLHWYSFILKDKLLGKNAFP